MRHSLLARTCFTFFCFGANGVCQVVSELMRIDRLNVETLVYRGEIIAKKSYEFCKMTSLGGDLSEGIKIGNLLADRAISAELEACCMSSCANNIFLAGHTKTLRPDSFWCLMDRLVELMLVKALMREVLRKILK